MNLPTFKNKKLFNQAFTHRSFLNESKEKVASNERLEFLGDSIISFLVSDYLFNTYNDFEEGTLTNIRSLLVNTKSLAHAAKELGFGTLLKLSRGEEESKGRENQSLLADCFEAFVGALFLDQGSTAARLFIEQTILQKAEKLVAEKSFKDPKSLLQEIVQAKKQTSPIYTVLSEEGPAHAKKFTVGAFVHDKMLGKGEGRSKQEAEEKAASASLKHFPPNKPLERRIS